jgi:hypothetical protein
MIPDKVVKNKDKLVVSQGHWIDGNGPMEVVKVTCFSFITTRLVGVLHDLQFDSSPMAQGNSQTSVTSSLRSI